MAREFAFPFWISAVSMLLPKTSQIILDNVVVLDKETASFDAPLARQVNHCQLSTISHSRSPMKNKLSGLNYQLSALVLALLLTPSTGSGQTLAPIRKPPLNEPLEQYNMPPAPPRKIGTPARTSARLGVPTSSP